MNIVYSSSDSYAFLTGISLLSLFENNKNSLKIDVYIMDNNISSLNKERLNSIAVQYNRNLYFIKFPNPEEITGRSINTGRWNLSTFGRLYMASSLPSNVHKALNIDCDTIILGSLCELFDDYDGDFTFGGVSECINYRYKLNIGKDSNSKYFNGGLVLLNLDSIREKKYEEKFTNYIMKYGDSLGYLDQDVINAIIPENEKVELPLKYDVLSPYFYVNYKQMKKMRHCKSFYSLDEYNDAKKDPIIVHFTTCFLDGLRPWIKGNKHPYLNKFLEFKSMSPWKNDNLKEDNRSKFSKLISFLVKIMPKFILLPIVGIIHGIIVPKKNYKNMRKEING